MSAWRKKLEARIGPRVRRLSAALCVFLLSSLSLVAPAWAGRPGRGGLSRVTGYLNSLVEDIQGEFAFALLTLAVVLFGLIYWFAQERAVPWMVGIFVSAIAIFAAQEIVGMFAGAAGARGF